jgi:hypothetical protein
VSGGTNDDGTKLVPVPAEKGDGYCWCGMCGYNAILPAKYRAEVEAQKACPWCEEGGMFSILGVCDTLGELEDNVDLDEPMMIWPQTDPLNISQEDEAS